MSTKKPEQPAPTSATPAEGTPQAKQKRTYTPQELVVIIKRLQVKLKATNEELIKTKQELVTERARREKAESELASFKKA